MTWREALARVLPDQAPAIAECIAARWSGANLYLPLRVARLRWRCHGTPTGASERFADELWSAIVQHGGTTDDARVVLLAITGRRFVV